MIYITEVDTMETKKMCIRDRAHSILVRKVVWKKLEKFSGYPADHAVFSGDQRDPAHDPLIFQGDF